MQTAPQHAKVLGSWKEIASYLGKGVRTVQRWERHFGLPVRRPNANAKGVVCALPDELDHWFEARWGRRSVKPAAPSGNGAHHHPMNASIQTAIALRDANLRLVQELMRSARGLAEECRALSALQTKSNGDSPKSDQKQ